MMSSALRAVDGDGVRRAVAGVPPSVPPRSTLTCGHVGPAQIVDGDGVGAAQRVEVDALDVVEVHGDVADVAGEARAAAVGGDVDVLVDVARR